MAGALLRSGNLTEFSPLGAVGKPVYSAASQLRAAIRRRAGPETAEVFAIPKQNDQGDIIDWYAPVAGDVVPWSAASAEERREAITALQATRAKLAELSNKLLSEDRSGSAGTELQVFGKLLAQATEIPGDDHIYLIDGRPAITFWGFRPLDAPPGYDVIGNLDSEGPAGNPLPVAAPVVATAGDGIGTGEAVAPAPPAEAAETPRRGWWWWLLPLLLLLLLLLLLWLGLRWWGIPLPFAPSLTLPVLVEEPQTPVAVEEPVIVDDRTVVIDRDGGTVVHGSDSSSVHVGADDRTVVTGSDTGTVTSGAEDRSLQTEGDSSGEGAPLAAPEDAPAVPEAEDPATAAEATDPTAPTQATDPASMPEDAAVPEGPGTEDAAMPEPPAEEESAVPEPGVTEAGRQPETPTATSQPPIPTPAPGQTGAPLMIPPQSVQDGSTGFLDGGWQSGTGLQDTSGNPLQLGYTFKGGEGAVTMQRAVGEKKQSCTGPAKSAMESGQLVITQGTIRCPDGTTFNAPRVVCKVGAGGRADCEGVNEDGSTFPVSMTR